MKKKYFGIIILLFVILFTLTGCGKKNPIGSEQGALDYLNENFPDDEFTIKEQDKIKLEALGTGYSYTVKSEKTDVEFTLKNKTERTYFGSSYYAVSSNYFEQAFEKYYDEYEDKEFKSKIKIRHNSDNDTVLDLSVTDFDSLDEIPMQSYKLFSYINKKAPFSNYKENYHFLTILIMNEDDYPCAHISYDNELDSSKEVTASFNSNIFQHYLSKYISNYNNSDFSKKIDLHVDYKNHFYKVNFELRLNEADFNSNKELSDNIYNFKKYIYSQDFNFKKYEPDLSIFIVIKDENYQNIGSFNLEDLNSEKDFYNYIR